MARKLKKMAALLAALTAPGVAFATNGYFSHGYGMKAKGMAGAGIALPQDALAAATNPAGMVFVGSRLDVGLDLFRPDRGAEITPANPAIGGTYDGNGAKNFWVPEFGYNRMLNPNLSVGLSVFGNGGMNTTYNRSPFGGFGGSNPAGVDLMQLFVAPSVAYKTGGHAFGLALNLAHQRFSADGLEPFGGVSNDASKLTGKGDDTSNGWGVRIGWTGQLSPAVTLGATYQSKTRMSKFSKYSGLFAEQGDFDIPANYGVGVAFKASPALTLAADIQRIEYGSVKSIANKLNQGCALPGGICALGTDNGTGFGWRDMTVLKVGASYEFNKSLTLRGGVSHGRQPIPQSETFFNVLAPGVVQTHLTLGATWTLANASELTVGYMHAFKKTVNGSGSIPAAFAGGEANIRLEENSIGIAYGIRM